MIYGQEATRINCLNIKYSILQRSGLKGMQGQYEAEAESASAVSYRYGKGIKIILIIFIIITILLQINLINFHLIA